MKNKKIVILIFILIILIVSLVLLLNKQEETDNNQINYYSKYLKNNDVMEDVLITSYDDFAKLSLEFDDINESFFTINDLFIHYETFNVCKEDIEEYIEFVRCDASKQIGFIISDTCDEKCTSTIVYLIPYEKGFVTSVEDISVNYTQLYKVCER